MSKEKTDVIRIRQERQVNAIGGAVQQFRVIDVPAAEVPEGAEIVESGQPLSDWAAAQEDN